MIHAITLIDFLAHKHTEVRLGPGMNVLTGPNNCGKSAVVEGLRCVASNPTPRHFIRHGAKEARVAVELDDGCVVTWIRKPKTVIYEILRPGAGEPETYAKLRKGQVPDEVRALLKLDPVELESGKASERSVDVHIGNQRKPIFLLDDDGADARLADFFAASSESAHLLAMQKALKNRVRESKMEEKGLQGAMREQQEQLDRLAPLPGLELELDRAARTEQQLAERERELPALAELLALKSRLERGLERERRRSAELDALADPPEPHDTATLSNALGMLASVRAGVASATRRAEVLAPLAPPPEPVDTAVLAADLERLSGLGVRGAALGKRVAVLDGLREPPQPLDLEPLAGLLRDMSGARDGLERLHKVRDAAQDKLAAAGKALEGLMERLGNCPLCGAALDADALLEREDA